MLSGDPKEVLGEIDPPTIQRVAVAVPRSYSRTRIEVHLTRRDGCALSVAGDDPEWVRAAYSSLVDELRQGVPWWHWLRSLPGAIAFGLFLGLPWPIAIILAGEWTSTVAEWLGTFGVFLLSLLSGGSYLVIMSLLPGFEVLTPGSPGRGRRVFGVIGVLIMGVISSLVATLILR